MERKKALMDIVKKIDDRRNYLLDIWLIDLKTKLQEQFFILALKYVN